MSLHQKSKFRIVVVFGIFIGLLFLLSNMLQSVVFFVASPAWKIGEIFSGYSVILHSKDSLLQENKRLKEQITFLQAESSIHNNADNDSSKASVVVRPPQSLYGTLIVRIKDIPVEKGDYVLVGSNIMIGMVDDVSFGFAKVILFSLPGYTQNFVVQRSGIPLVVEGRGSGNMRARLPYGADIEVHDVVVDPLSSRIIAEVIDVSEEDTDTFMNVLLKTPVNILELQDVYIRAQESLKI